LTGFDWAATDAESGHNSMWEALQSPARGSEDDPIPVVIDQNTAMWSLQMTGGVGEKRTFEYEDGKPITFQVIGLLSNSVLQGKLLIGNDNFETVFEEISGYQFFLVSCEDERTDEVASLLENRLGDIGMDLSNANDVLSGLLAVQNTYLRTFQSLGALGLLLGTIGLAVAQLRSVLERRQELAVMRAIGFTQKRLAAVVMTETATLLLMGIGCGVLCAVLAVLPHAILGGLTPPILEPLLIVAGIILFGMLAGLVAVRRVSRMPLLESLRAD
jgi:ABC-type antimicrobial peptide transport system permease subunit